MRAVLLILLLIAVQVLPAPAGRAAAIGATHACVTTRACDRGCGVGDSHWGGRMSGCAMACAVLSGCAAVLAPMGDAEPAPRVATPVGVWPAVAALRAGRVPAPDTPPPRFG